MKRSPAAIALSIILAYASLAYAQLPVSLPTKKIHPPYPEVWGYDITDFRAIQAYRMSDGDIWFLMQGNRGGEVLLKFFKGEKIELDAQQKNMLSKILKGKEIHKSAPLIHFKDGSTLQVYYGKVPKLCIIPEFVRNYYIKTDTQGNQKKYSILGASPHVNVYKDEECCDFKAASYFYERLYFSNILIDLGDDTFITYAQGGNLILRFDRNLNTPFKPTYSIDTISGKTISRNFFVIEHSLIDELKQKVRPGAPLYQTIHDELLVHFTDKYQPQSQQPPS